MPLSLAESTSDDAVAVGGALCAPGPPPRTAPPRPRLGFAMIWTGPVCPKPLCTPCLETRKGVRGR